MMKKADSSGNNSVTENELKTDLTGTKYHDFMKWMTTRPPEVGKKSKFKKYDTSVGRARGSMGLDDFTNAVYDWTQELSEEELAHVGFPAEKRMEEGEWEGLETPK